MLFRVIATIASVGFIFQGALAQQPAQVLVTAINLATTQTAAANTALALITPLTPPALIGTVVTNVAESYNTIIQDLLTEVTALLSATPPPPPACVQSEDDEIIPTFKGVVRNLQTLVRVVNDAENIWFTIRLPSEQKLLIWSLLTALESSFATLAEDLVRLVPCTADDISSIVDEIERILGPTITLLN